MRTYEKYKDSGISWIGKVPEDWEVTRGKYCFSVLYGFPFDSHLFYPSLEKGMPLLRIRDITSGNLATGYLGKYDEEYVIKSGDLLVGMDGDFNVRWWNGRNALLNQRCCKIMALKEMHLKYIFYALPFELKVINDLAYSTTVKHLLNPDIANLCLPQPSYKEQEAIANYLDKKTAEIDKIIAEREKKIELLIELKSSIISRAVTKGINPHAKMKDSGIDWFPIIPCDWEYSSLRHVCKKITDGSHFSPMSQLEGRPYITVTNIRNNKVYVDEALKISDEDFKTLVATGCQPLPGDVLLSKDGTVGRTAIVTSNDYVVLSSLGILRPSSLIDSKYLEYCLNSNALQMQMQMMMDGSALRRITIKKICNLLVLIPPMHEQLSIVKYLDEKTVEVSDSISTIRKECELYKEYKQSLISEVVTGKRKVID